VKQWVQQVIHLYGLGISLTAEEADDFTAFQSGVLTMIVLPNDIALAASSELGISTRLAQKEAYVVRYMEKLGDTMIAEGWSETQLRCTSPLPSFRRGFLPSFMGSFLHGFLPFSAPLPSRVPCFFIMSSFVAIGFPSPSVVTPFLPSFLSSLLSAFCPSSFILFYPPLLQGMPPRVSLRPTCLRGDYQSPA
jgi:hypothetical protein